MTREEFRIAIDTSLSKDRVKLCLEYINDLESRTCENCKHFIEMNWTDIDNKCASNKTKITYTDKDFGCNQFERKQDE